MLRVTIELVPFGIESRSRVVRRIYVANDGSGTRTRGNYKVTLKDPRRKPAKIHAHVLDFQRKRFGYTRLVGLALKALARKALKDD